MSIEMTAGNESFIGVEGEPAAEISASASAEAESWLEIEL